jgi:hypothetical protein
MPSKREEIRANAKRADELAKQLAAEGKLMPSEGSKTAVFTNEIPDFSAPTTEPEAKEAVAEPSQPQDEAVENISSATEKPAAEEVQVEEVSVSEKQYKSAVKAMNEAQRKAAEAERLLKQQAEENEKFKNELLAIKQQLSQKQPEVSSVSLIDQALDKWKEEYPDTVNMNRATAQAVKQEVESMLQTRLSSVEEQIRASREEQERFKILEQIRLRDERVKQVHTDYDDIRLSDEFKSWIYGDAPSIYKSVYEGSIPFDDRDAIKIMDDYKSFSKPPEQLKPVVSRPKPGAAEVSVKTASAVNADMGLNTEPEFSADDVAKLPYMIHRIKDPAQRKALMDKADKFMSKALSKTK